MDGDQFNSIRAYNFITTASIWLVISIYYLSNRALFSRELRSLLTAVTIVIACVVAYAAIGAIANPKGSIIYFRNIAAPLMLFQVCLIVTYRFSIRYESALKVLGLILLGAGYFELLARDTWMTLINSERYMEHISSAYHDSGVWLKEMQETGRVFRSIKDTLEVNFFNTPLLADLNIKVDRLLGPNLHSISYSYALVFFSLYFLSRGRIWYFVLALPLLLVIGSKGATIALAFSLVAYMATRFIHGRAVLLAFCSVLAVYAVAAIRFGLESGDYHVVGFLSGVDALLSNPLGLGLGAGGNYGANVTQIDWSAAQQLHRTDFAVESAVGVLLYQMGAAAFVVLAIYAWVALQAWRRFQAHPDRALAIVPFAVLVTLTNGIFHEEALFSPLAMGSMMVLAGMSLGASFGSRAQVRPAKAALPS